ncbi:MAG: GDP-mannose 4,6-dehydratase, partial [Lentisphaeraceae bacterium]|nr:GDP-mannose 4,6-dehydratase [Lentisphaeraceae bacterium]
MSKILITGGSGCIGAATIFQLLQSATIDEIIVASRSADKGPLELWFGQELDPRIKFVTLDLSDFETMERIVLDINPTHIIHLGAFQSPDCATYHQQGLHINVAGTMALFDIAEKLPNLQRFVFASSAAVYGMRSMYPEPGITEEAQLAPP